MFSVQNVCTIVCITIKCKINIVLRQMLELWHKVLFNCMKKKNVYREVLWILSQTQQNFAIFSQQTKLSI